MHLGQRVVLGVLMLLALAPAGAQAEPLADPFRSGPLPSDALFRNLGKAPPESLTVDQRRWVAEQRAWRRERGTRLGGSSALARPLGATDSLYWRLSSLPLDALAPEQRETLFAGAAQRAAARARTMRWIGLSTGTLMITVTGVIWYMTHSSKHVM